MFVVTGVTTAKSTAVHNNYQLQSGFTLKFLEFVWSEQPVLDGQAFSNPFRSYFFARKSPCIKLGIKIELHQCLELVWKKYHF